MLSTSRDVRHIDSQITADNYTFDTVKEFIYLGSAKLIRLCRMTLSNSCSFVNVALRTFWYLINFVMESVLRKTAVHCNGNIFRKGVYLLVYADDINIIGHIKRNKTAAFIVHWTSTKMGLAVNEGKTKCMLSIIRDVWRIDTQITGDNYTFDTVKKFIYLSFAVSTKNDVSLEIKCRITLANSCYLVSMANWVAEIFLVRQN